MKRVLLLIAFLIPASVFAATDYYVDADYNGTPRDGTAAHPWKSLTDTATNTPWTVINSGLANGPVTVYFSAREATNDVSDQCCAVDLNRTNTSTNRLTLDGMTKWNTNDTAPAWQDYNGLPTRDTPKAKLVNQGSNWAIGWGVNPPIPAMDYVTIRGFETTGAYGRFRLEGGGSHFIVEYNYVHDVTGGGPGMQFNAGGYAYSAGPTDINPGGVCTLRITHLSDDVIFRYNHINNTADEGLYFGGNGEDGNGHGYNCPGHTNIQFIGNTIANAGIGVGEGDCFDLKNGNRNITYSGNIVGPCWRNGIPLIGAAVSYQPQTVLVEKNLVHDTNTGGGTGGITAITTWTTVPSAVTIRNNVLYNSNITAGDGNSNTNGDGAKYNINIYNNTIDTGNISMKYINAGSLENNLILSGTGAAIGYSQTSSFTDDYNARQGTGGSGAHSISLSSGQISALFADKAGRDYHLASTASALYNAGTNTLCPVDDYYGNARPQAGICDIGAVELIGGPAPPTPNIASLSLTGGPAGTGVTITGTNFGATQGASTVKFNGTTATAASWSATSIGVTVPVGATTGSVVVTVAGQNSNGINFTVTLPPPPSITSLSVTTGNVGSAVTITGTNFGATQGASTVKFNGTAATPTGWSATSIVVTVPVGATTGSVVVTVAGQNSNSVNFTVTLPPPPSILSLSVTTGTVGAAVTITGTNFGATQGASTVKFNGTAATPAGWSATSIGVTVPVGATTGNVVVTVAGQSSNGKSFTVSVPPTPAITSLSATSGDIGKTVTITGTNFGATQGTSTVKFNGAAATPTSWSATSIGVTVPVGATTGNVVVTVAGQSSNGIGFTVLDSAPPVISTMTPANGTIVSGTSVAISANATDDIAVAAVWFLLDGNALGGNLLSSPYNLAWNSTLATDGFHTLTANARDAAGHLATPLTVTVRVSNLKASYTIPPSGGQSFDLTGASNTTPTVSHARIESDTDLPTGIAIIDYLSSTGTQSADAATSSILISEAGVPATAETLVGMAYVDIGGPVNTGVAIANQSTSSAVISYYFTDANGAIVKQGSLTLAAKRQIAAFLDAAPFSISAPFRGTFSFNSSVPVAMIATRGFTNERKDFLFSTMPIAIAAPDSDPLLPMFADGGGWNTQVILTNDSADTLTGSVEFFDQGSLTTAAALNVTVNGTTGSIFPYLIPPHSMFRMVTQGPSSDATLSGSVRVTSVPNLPTGNSPNAFAILSYKSNEVTVSETSVFAVPASTAFRMYVESAASTQGQILSGIAVTNASWTSNTVVLNLTKLDGTPAAGVQSFDLAGRGEISKFLNELFADLPSDFRGILSVSAAAPVGVVDLRGRYNSRKDFLVTTIPPVDVTSPATGTVVFPHLVNGGGYNTQIILFGAPISTATGNLAFISPNGAPIPGASSPTP